MSPNGLVRFYPDCLDCAGIAVSEKYTVAHDTYQGEIWIRKIEGNFLIVSWEDVGFDDMVHTNLNAQMTLYPNGNVDLCWGEGWSDRPIRATIWDASNDWAFPVNSGPPFQQDGSFDTDWPANQCRFFRPNDNGSMGWFETQTCPGQTCETATPIRPPHYNSGSLANGTDSEMFSMTCDRYPFDTSVNDVVWYEVESSTSDCSCVEFRSMDNAFTVGIFSSPTGGANCTSLECVSATDFTSESIVWRYEPNQTYRIAGSVLPGTSEGRFTLSVVDVDKNNIHCPEVPGAFTKVPGSCMDL